MGCGAMSGVDPSAAAAAASGAGGCGGGAGGCGAGDGIAEGIAGNFLADNMKPQQSNSGSDYQTAAQIQPTQQMPRSTLPA